MALHPSLGFYGKLPGVGDFVQRRLPAEFVLAWDAHFARCLDTARNALDAAWPAAYRGSGVRAFVLGAGVCGPQAWAGAIAPGEDRVGRCFPLVVALPLAASSLPSPAWFGDVCACLGQALRARADVALLETALETAAHASAALPPATRAVPLLAPGLTLWWRPGAAPQAISGLPTPDQYLDWLLAGQDITEVTG
ncbi:type VI secretion system-associated protein TagF [Xanthomonas maliensis]|uniref:type VI secretion system-associated protein TagF n=1 Tax=Xanthomonas maliensis TaxID=1321368 RepID=UPI0003B58C3A|nr:type VI secretion system-associated protein TagF [Xanthomonas maliensis]KAB7764184.1 type VI secretion system-associated protein TagF [Xanthomonas maliensis]